MFGGAQGLGLTVAVGDLLDFRHVKFKALVEPLSQERAMAPEPRLAEILEAEQDQAVAAVLRVELLEIGQGVVAEILLDLLDIA